MVLGMNNTNATFAHIEEVASCSASIAWKGEYFRKLAAAADMALAAYGANGERGIRDLLASLRRTEADEVVLAEIERIHHTV